MFDINQLIINLIRKKNAINSKRSRSVVHLYSASQEM
jgi:hypothetical protein